jgi:hypothetical protein
LQQHLDALALRLQTLWTTHPRRIMAGVAVALSVMGGGAFAVANLGPDASQLPMRSKVARLRPSGSFAYPK